MHRLTNFHYLVKAEGSPLRDHVRQLVVATTDATELPQLAARLVQFPCFQLSE